MFRKTVWKNTVSDALSWQQDQALNTTIFILKEYGPTGFLLKEEREPKHLKVCLGDPHTCTCPTFLKERELCKHICWVLMRKFRLPREHEYCFQQGLVERQILEVLQGLHKSRTPRPADTSVSETPRPDPGQEHGGVLQKDIQTEDVCPICQEELLMKRLPVSYCRFGCGNNVHISCMKVWADHQTCSEQEAMVKCPLCREDFGPVKLLQNQVKNAARTHTAAERERPDRHLGVLCNNCRVCPITGKCFKCTVCSYYHLCEDCVRRSCHPQHQFAMRTSRNQKWLPMGQRVFHTLGELRVTITQSVDDSMIPIENDPVPEHIVRSLPTVRVRRGSLLLDPGQQCRICLKSFHLGQHARTLPCHHKFHTDCVDSLLRRSNSCPLDGYVIYNPLTWSSTGGKSLPKLASNAAHTQAKLTEQHRLELFVPGVAMLDKTARVAPSLSMVSSKGLAVALVPPLQDPVVKGLQGLCINKVIIEDVAGKGEAEEGRTPVKSVFREKNQLSRDASRSHCSTKSLGQHTAATSTNRLAAVYGEAGGGQQQGLFVGFNKSDRHRPAAVTHSRSAVVGLWRSRPKWKLKARIPRPGTGDRQTLGLRMTGVLITTQHQGEKE